ncbi:hypothetical protein LSAT2_018712 [Lamellibrachia satsuma]|nr:hypothetical protein LSAT2_018712 [Lamellibrachia satsuma]
MERLFLFLISLLAFISTVCSLECYACIDQDSNKEKCIKTVKQCEEEYDSCVSTIRWAIPPYWTPVGDRIYYISKDCNTMKKCREEKINLGLKCKRDWYNDWECIECCAGDLCNYYVTLGAGSVKSSFVVISSGILCAIMLWWSR